MCGRVVWIWDAKTGKLVQKIDDRALDDPERARVLHKKRYNVPPASHLPVIDGRAVPDGGDARIAIARWGFPIPKRPNGVFNTRIETAAESPMWRGMVGRTHCVWPVQGFYEWRRDGKQRTPYFIHRADGEVMLLAGVLQTRTWDGAPKDFGSIVTCGPNRFMQELHDRMPVVLEEADLMAWLGADAETAFRLAVPAGDVLARHAVTPDAGDTKNDDPRLMEPVDTQGLGAFT